jgi:hypothetical protein
MKNLFLPRPFMLALLLAVVSGCTITVMHKFEDRYYQYNKAGTTPMPDDSPTLPPSTGPAGDITFVNDPDKEETVGISKLIPGRREPQFITWLLPEKEITLQAAIGDVFFFEIKDVKDFTLPPYTVSEFDQSYQLEIGMRWKDARVKYARTTNADANRFSFDIFHINPLYIDQLDKDGGGKKQQIFESLGEDDRDWKVYDGDVALKKTFDLKVVDRGEGTTETRMYYGSQAFKKGFSANVGVSGGVPGATGSLSVGFNKMTQNESSQGEVFTYTRKADTVYIIDLVPQYAKLDRPFKEAVLGLLPPATTPANLTQAKAQAGFDQYQKFVREWGTHFPKRVHYGGFFVAYQRNSMEELMNEDGWGISVKAGVEAPVGAGSVGVEGSFGYSEREKYASKERNEKMGYFHVGGRGDDNSWNVGDKVQPIKIQLSRLDELLTPLFFKDETSESELTGRRAMLKFALEEYIGSRTDAGETLAPKVYRMTADNWRIIKGPTNDSEFDLYGDILMAELTTQEGVNLWSAKKEDNSRVSKGKTMKFPKGKEISTIIYPSQGKFNTASYQYLLVATLLWDNPYFLSPQHCIGLASESINFSQVNTNPQQSLRISFRKGKYKCDEVREFPGLSAEELEELEEFRKNAKDNFEVNGDWEIDIEAKVYQVEFSKLGFDGF